MIYFIRFITAVCLFSFLGKANIWLNPLSNIILAIGYRFFLIFSPFFKKYAGKHAVLMALLLTMLGIVLFIFNIAALNIIGAFLVSTGLSVSGFLIKAEVSEIPSGAAHNKIALNAGSLLAGIILLISIHNKNYFFIGFILLLFITCIISSKLSTNKKECNIPHKGNKDFKKLIGWSLIGITTGIKLFGVFSVLPQYILHTRSVLPNWYGLIVLLNSGVVILLQLPIIKLIQKFDRNNNSFNITISMMFLGMLLIAYPNIFLINTLGGALIWTILLSIIECSASYLDVQSSREGYLFIKEVSVGLGAGVTVALSRYLPPSYSSLSIGLTGAACIIIAVLLLRYEYIFNYVSSKIIRSRINV